MEQLAARMEAISTQLSRMEARVEELGAELQANRVAYMAYLATTAPSSAAVLAALQPVPAPPPPVLIYHPPEPAQNTACTAM
jgi:septal ring factor EnvC (AmiA/AmiB activator)